MVTLSLSEETVGTILSSLDYNLNEVSKAHQLMSHEMTLPEEERFTGLGDEDLLEMIEHLNLSKDRIVLANQELFKVTQGNTTLPEAKF